MTGHTGMPSYPDDATSRSAMETQAAGSACSDQNALMYGSSAHISGRRKHQRPPGLSSTVPHQVLALIGDNEVGITIDLEAIRKIS